MRRATQALSYLIQDAKERIELYDALDNLYNIVLERLPEQEQGDQDATA